MNPFGLLVSIKDYSIWDLFLRVHLINAACVRESMGGYKVNSMTKSC